jgi:hypothetical protein
VTVGVGGYHPLMDTAQLIQSIRDGDYPAVATAVALPPGHRALTVTTGVVWWRYGVGWDQGEQVEVTTTSHDVIMRSWTQVLSWGWHAIDAAQLLECDLLLCQGRSTTGETSFMLRTDAAQLTFCLWAAHRNPTHPQVPALLEALTTDPSSPMS